MHIQSLKRLFSTMITSIEYWQNVFIPIQKCIIIIISVKENVDECQPAIHWKIRSASIYENFN